MSNVIVTGNTMTDWIGFQNPKETFSSKEQFEWIKLVCETLGAQWIKSRDFNTEWKTINE